MAYDWFVVPLSAGGIDDAETVPKYSDQADGFSGTWQHFDQQTYPDLPWAGEDRWVVRFYADEATLDAIAGNDDAYALYRNPNVSEADVVEYLNDVTDSEHTFEEWEQSFLA